MTFSLFAIGLVALLAFGDMAYWWYGTRGAWSKWPAGRSVMALLGMIGVITTLAFSSIWIGYEYPYRALVYGILYMMMAFVLIWIGLTIRRELKHGGEIRPNVTKQKLGAKGSHNSEREES